MLTGSVAESLDEYLRGNDPRGVLDYARSDPWSVAGSAIITQHPNYPHVMCELETARGCSHGACGGCSFCTEPFYGKPHYRGTGGIAAETAALHACGARHFRIGRQPDILAYGAGSGEYPAPEPDKIEKLFSAVRSAAPELKTLHIDNVSPATIARHDDAAREALAAIVRHHTPGDVAAFGMETADPGVVSANNLKAQPDEVFRAIAIVNEAGGMRRDGIPELLPGLNFVCGLAGETEKTYDLNEQFLARVLASGYLVRRVNIRQLMPFPGTPAYGNNTLGKHERRFRAFKEHARQKFDLPMLKKVFPAGTVLRDVIIEESDDLSFGRQMGSYPILAGIPIRLPVHTVLDVAVVDWGMRSVTALPVPIRINELPASALKWLPGVPKKAGVGIIAKRPFKNIQEFRNVAGATPLDHLFSF
jgi:radical SAM superfamily enzyme with C-terminal helix-hairpin-helix motif